MSITISGEQIQTALAGIAGAITATSIMWVKIVKPARRAFAWLEEFRSDWSGTLARPGVPGRDGMMLRMATNEAAIAEIRHEVQTNSGGSLRDAVNATQTAVVKLQRQMDVATLIMPQNALQRADGASEIEGAST